MPRRKQDRPKRMKWEDGGEPCKDEEMPGPDKGRDPVEDEEDEAEGSPAEQSDAHSQRTETEKEEPEEQAAEEEEDDQEEEEEEEGEAEERTEDDKRMVSCPELSSRPSPEMTLPVAVKVEPETGDSDVDPAEPLPLPPTVGRKEQSSSPAPKVDRTPSMTASPPPPPVGGESPLDFSMKKGVESAPEATDTVVKEEMTDDEGNQDAEDTPLDLSVPRRRKAGSSSSRKLKAAKLDTALPKPTSPWGYNVPKALPPAAPLSSGKLETAIGSWNGKLNKSHHHHHHHYHHGQQSERTSHGSSGKSFASGAVANSKLVHSPGPQVHVASTSPAMELSGSTKSSGGASRQNPWQTQWMSKSGEQAKDVFTCVWCKESFRSLAEMTVHMKQSPRCGMAGMQASSVPPVTAVSPQPSPSVKSAGGTSSGSGCSSGGGVGSNVLVKESMPLPRKLVRGQDVWLGKGAEQTRQILKCMWCGQSFKTLADMTTHMRVTQHYTNIISQEQIISWRTPEDKMAAQSQVNAVLTCKVCDQAFGSLKELSYHMVKNSHYKEHILRSISEGGGRRRQTRERRKKSLPVRKLLELERMEMGKQGQHSNQSGTEGPRGGGGGGGEPAADGKITCEECAEKVDAKDFVQHIKSCSAQRNNHQRIKNELCEESGDEGAGPALTPGPDTVPSPEPKTSDPPAPSSATTAGTATPTSENAEKTTENSKKPGQTSVLNAIERLIEKSFEYKGRRGQPTTGILQRLGIDEEVYPPWHPANSPGGKSSLLVKGSDRAKSTSPLRFEPGDLARHEELSRKRLFDAYNHVSASSETSRGSTPISLMNTSSPTRSLTESPHRTHSSMTGSTAGSPPPSPHSLLHSPKPVSEYGSSVRGGEDDGRGSEAARSPKNGRPDTDGSLCGSPKPTVYFERPSRCSSVSSFDGRRSPLSDNEPVRPPSTEPLELKTSPSGPAAQTITKRKRPKSRHERSKGAKRSAKGETEEKRSVSADSILSSISSEGAKASASDLSADHPLKELQKLLDKTDAHLSRPALPSGPGSILAFSWACNDVTTSDSLMKCAFCETHFISKGAYRHHLSKMHFVKEPLGSPGDSPTWKGGDKTKNGSPESGPGSSAAASSSSVSMAPKEASAASLPPAEESPHSKFLKYTELAKQLSSKYV